MYKDSASEFLRYLTGLTRRILGNSVLLLSQTYAGDLTALSSSLEGRSKYTKMLVITNFEYEAKNNASASLFFKI